MYHSPLARRLFQGAFRALTGYDHPVTLTAGDAGELERRLAWINDRVPPRSRRTRGHQDHKEWYCARRYLLALAQAGCLAYPLALRKAQSPDFLMEWPNGSVSGLEVAEVTSEEFQRNLARTEDIPGAHPRGPEEGWTGEAAEQALAEAILAECRKKADKIRSPHWLTADRHDLLLYSNGPWIGPDLARVTALVRERLAALDSMGYEWPNGPLGTVSLLHGHQVVIDLVGAGAVETLDPARN